MLFLLQRIIWYLRSFITFPKRITDEGIATPFTVLAQLATCLTEHICAHCSYQLSFVNTGEGALEAAL